MELGYPIPGDNASGGTRTMILDCGDALLRTWRIWGKAVSGFRGQRLASPVTLSISDRQQRIPKAYQSRRNIAVGLLESRGFQ